MITKIRKYIVFAIIILFNCSFNVIDIGNIDITKVVYKNVGLLDMKSDQNLFPSNTIKKKLDSINSDKLYTKPKFPEINSENLVKNFNIKKNIKKIHFNTKDLESIFVMTNENIDNMFHLSDLGIKKIKDTSSSDARGGIQVLGDASSDPFIQPNISALPIYKTDDWMPKKIDDIKIKGLDDILPTSIAPPFKEQNAEIDSTTDYFKDYLIMDDVLDTGLVDLLP